MERGEQKPERILMIRKVGDEVRDRPAGVNE